MRWISAEAPVANFCPVGVEYANKPMNTKTRLIGSLLMVLAALCLFNGCASTAGSGSYQLKQTRNDLDWAMIRYHNRLSFGFISLGEEQQVTAAYKAYQTAFNEAVKQAHSDYNTPTPDNVKQLADQLLSILGSIP
jgi:hypothetical protein